MVPSNSQARRAHQKRVGAFYTPVPAAEALVSWALNGQAAALLDPSFGDGSLLDAALGLAGNTRVRAQAERLHGFEIDASRSQTAKRLVQAGIPTANLRLTDFLAVPAPTDDEERFDAVAANPPYVRHHWQTLKWQEQAQARMLDLGVTLSRRASAWAYFVIHSVSFVRKAGRLAFLLPGASVQANYSYTVFAYLCEHFSNVRLVRVSERIFRADEETVVLAAAQKGGATSDLRYEEVSTLAQLPRVLARNAGASRLPRSRGELKLQQLPKRAADLFRSLVADEGLTTLGQVADLSLGVVTGANSFFIRPRGHIPNDPAVTSVSIIPRARWLVGVEWTFADRLRSDREGRPSRLLVVAPHSELGVELTREVRSSERAGIAARAHCSRRQPWYSVRNYAAPDAFLAYMGAVPRGLVLNSGGSTSTNAIHRIRWKPACISPEGLALSSWTTLTRLAAEIYGRHYGGGILKLELQDAERLLLVDARFPTLAREELDDLVRRCRFRDAYRLADQRVLREKLGLSAGEVCCLTAAADYLHARRRRCPRA